MWLNVLSCHNHKICLPLYEYIYGLVFSASASNLFPMLNWSTQLIGWERQFGREIVNELHSTDWYGAVHSTVVSQWYGTVIYHSTMVIPLVWHRIRWSPIHLISTSPVQKRVNSSAVNQEDFLLFPVIHISSNLGVFLGVKIQSWGP